MLGWGVGGIEAEAAMLGQPVTMLIPHVIGFKLVGSLPAGTTATDLVLTVTEMLRKKGVVDKFVEFFGDGLANLPLADRATIANMAPEFGSTCAIFPIDEETLRYLELTGRSADHIAMVKAYAQHQGMWRENGQPQADYTDVLELDLGTVEPSLAGPKRPQDRVPLRTAKQAYQAAHKKMAEERAAKNPTAKGAATATVDGKTFPVADGAVLIAAITSCTNTSNPAVLIGAGLLARNARRRGLNSKPWVKTSLAPGSRVVTDYLDKAGLSDDLEALGFYTVGYGCTTCIGNSGPLQPEISEAVRAGDVIACFGALRQSQLRRPRASGSEDELPRLAAAGGRVRARRHAQPRPDDRAARHRQRRQAGLPQGHLADAGRDPRVHRQVGRLGDVQEGLRERVHRRRELERDPAAERQDLRLGREVDLREEPAVLRRHDDEAGRGRRHPQRARAGAARRLGHDRPHLAGRRHLQDPARLRNTWCRSACSRPTSTPTARGAAITK